jgi:glycosyltransferase involved in cell wall biosynthesis
MSLKEANASITLSAVIPVGGFPNGDAALRTWLLSQLPQGLEVILVMDTDEESVRKSILEIAGSNNRNINVLLSQYRNPGSTREIGLRACTGKWVCFWDSDDLPEVSNIWSSVNNSENQGADIIVGNFRSINFETKIEDEYRHGTSNRLMNVYLNPGLWRFVFKRELLDDISFPALTMGEDQVFLFRSIAQSKEIKFIDNFFYNYYNYSTGQLTKSKNISIDLMKARDLCKGINASHQSNYLLSAILKQDMTLIKRGNLTIKYATIADLITLSTRSINNLKTLFRLLVKMYCDK